MTARNDVSRVDFVTNFPLPSSGTGIPLGQLPANPAGGPVTIQGPFSVQSMLGLDNVSVTFSTPASSTAVGVVFFQGTDFGGSEYDIYNPNIPWSTLYFPNTGTIAAQNVTAGAFVGNLQLSMTGIKWVRLAYNATSGTGTINAALTARANSRT